MPIAAWRSAQPHAGTTCRYTLVLVLQMPGWETIIKMPLYREYQMIINKIILGNINIKNAGCKPEIGTTRFWSTLMPVLQMPDGEKYYNASIQRMPDDNK